MVLNFGAPMIEKFIVSLVCLAGALHILEATFLPMLESLQRYYEQDTIEDTPEDTPED